jgi:hypothetical protein
MFSLLFNFLYIYNQNNFASLLSLSLPGAGLNSIPPDFISRGLQILEKQTGCGGIVNWNIIDDIISVSGILDLIP